MQDPLLKPNTRTMSGPFEALWSLALAPGAIIIEPPRNGPGDCCCWWFAVRCPKGSRVLRRCAMTVQKLSGDQTQRLGSRFHGATALQLHQTWAAVVIYAQSSSFLQRPRSEKESNRGSVAENPQWGPCHRDLPCYSVRQPSIYDPAEATSAHVDVPQVAAT